MYAELHGLHVYNERRTAAEHKGASLLHIKLLNVLQMVINSCLANQTHRENVIIQETFQTLQSLPAWCSVLINTDYSGLAENAK